MSNYLRDYFKVLFIGGTGAISSSAVKEALSQGMSVSVLNRGRTSSMRPLPPEVESIVADVGDFDSVRKAIGDRHFDAVVNFLTYGTQDSKKFIEIFTGHTGHYLHISSSSVYHRPLPKTPISESTYAFNPGYGYMEGKVETEHVFLKAFEEGFPVTLIRPAHTYDDAIAPLAGSWAVIDRIEKGQPVVLQGDGTQLWTLTHASDLAVGLIGLLGRRSTFGEAFHITSNDVLSWNQIYEAIGHALGVRPNILHLTTDFIKVAEPDWFWSGLFDGDLQHSGVYDNTKIRNYVPGFNPTKVFEREIFKIIAWRKEHPQYAVPEPEELAVYDRLAAAHARAKAALRA
ncbi:MAG: NAD-dependent epimerase/dehydratase family protein [Propionibacteriaceae bacterium]|jgi:nucleoside-diphosphate-sugar epimerase|nr:NAD-dependent epimerase/dehydratase family protein [Propionibacteriaceae bacterium]